MEADDLVKLLLGAISALSMAVAWMYRADNKFKSDLIDRLLSAQEKQAEQQHAQTDLSQQVIMHVLEPAKEGRKQ